MRFFCRWQGRRWLWSEVSGQLSEVRGQRSEVRGQLSEVSGHWSLVFGLWFLVFVLSRVLVLGLGGLESGAFDVA